jgi:hypothetical protein
VLVEALCSYSADVASRRLRLISRFRLERAPACFNPFNHSRSLRLQAPPAAARGAAHGRTFDIDHAKMRCCSSLSLAASLALTLVESAWRTVRAQAASVHCRVNAAMEFVRQVERVSWYGSVVDTDRRTSWLAQQPWTRFILSTLPFITTWQTRHTVRPQLFPIR